MHSCDKIKPLSFQDKLFSHYYGYGLSYLASEALEFENRKQETWMSLTSVFGIHYSLTALNTENVKMQNFRMRLSHACFLFGRQLMKCTAD